MSSRSFKLSDAIALATVSLVLAALLFTGCGEGPLGQARSKARSMQNGTQVRGIQQGFVLFSNSNNTFYPAYDSDGNDDFAAVDRTPGTWGCGKLTDDDVSKIYAIMLTAEFFTAEYITSPIDDRTEATGDYRAPGAITPANYSYALLDMNDEGSNRRNEWKDTNNSQAPIVADPSSDIRDLKTISYHTDKTAAAGNSDTDYRGNLGWNDNHVTFEQAGLFPVGTLKLGNEPNAGSLNPFKNTGNDGAKFIW